MNDMRKLMEAVETIAEASGVLETFAFYHVDDYGRPEAELPFVVISVESTGDKEADEKTARKLGVAEGIPDLNTGFLVSFSDGDMRTDLLDKFDELKVKLDKTQNVIRAVSTPKANKVTVFRDNRD